MNKLNFLGAGPKIARILIPWLAATLVIRVVCNDMFRIATAKLSILMIVGIIFMVTGLIFYAITVKGLLRGLKETKLVITGGYFMCQNPLYSSLILFIIPGLAILLNSWLMLATTPIGYILFKVYIKSEYEELELFFGKYYLEYRDKTPEFFPFPVKKFNKK